MAGYSPMQINRILGEGAAADLKRQLDYNQREFRSNMMEKIQDKVVEAQVEFIEQVKSAEWEIYQSVHGELLEVTKAKMKEMSVKDRYMHVRTLLAAQKYVYNTLGIKMATEERGKAPKSLTQININQYRTTPPNN